jgi:hypothetical protein
VLLGQGDFETHAVKREASRHAFETPTRRLLCSSGVNASWIVHAVPFQLSASVTSAPRRCRGQVSWATGHKLASSAGQATAPGSASNAAFSSSPVW